LGLSVNLEYPESEAASLENLIFRQEAAPKLFLGCYLRKDEVQDDSPSPTPNNPNSGNTEFSSLELIGYIVSTLVSGDHLTHSSMSSHNPSGDAVCIHSVCVSSAFQRRGVATRMLKEYLQHLQGLNNNVNASSSSNKLKRVLLIAHEHTIGLYAGVGFALIGKSAVEHGPDPWFEMVYTLDH
jgi:ribosomal protein S18 acetylase RimI-like enzyme